MVGSAALLGADRRACRRSRPQDGSSRPTAPGRRAAPTSLRLPTRIVGGGEEPERVGRAEVPGRWPFRG